VALRFLDHVPGQTSEEAFDVRLANEQTESQLNHVSLHRGQALGAPPFLVFARQRRAQHVHIVRRKLGRRRDTRTTRQFVLFHMVIIGQVRPPETSSKSRRSGSADRLGQTWRGRTSVACGLCLIVVTAPQMRNF
jgi:hypothetical protein